MDQSPRPYDSVESQFLADIAANPADDTPRLIYADWLEDQGRPERALNIRRGIKNPSRVTYYEFVPGAGWCFTWKTYVVTKYSEASARGRRGVPVFTHSNTLDRIAGYRVPGLVVGHSRGFASSVFVNYLADWGLCSWIAVHEPIEFAGVRGLNVRRMRACPVDNPDGTTRIVMTGDDYEHAPLKFGVCVDFPLNSATSTVDEKIHDLMGGSKVIVPKFNTTVDLTDLPAVAMRRYCWFFYDTDVEARLAVSDAMLKYAKNRTRTSDEHTGVLED